MIKQILIGVGGITLVLVVGTMVASPVCRLGMKCISPMTFPVLAIISLVMMLLVFWVYNSYNPSWEVEKNEKEKNNN